MSSLAKLQVTPMAIHDVLLIEPHVFGDDRGWFMESYNAQDFRTATGLDVEFVQDNQSFSRQWTLRGLHYQLEQTQGKLVRVVAGSVFDVAVDIRQDSPSYGKWVGVELTAQNHRQLWLPPGMAHGFLVLSGSAEFFYKTTDFYHPESEVCLAWNDAQAAIEWPLPFGQPPNLNTKDSAGLSWDVAPKLKVAI